MRLVSELRRRNVLRMAALYAVAAWLIVQVAGALIDLAKLPDWAGTTILWLLAVGFPIALIFSWFYEITPEGISLEKDIDPTASISHVTGRRLDFIVISMLCAAVILFAYDKWWTAAPVNTSIAVLPFVNMSDDPNNEYFSDGISEEILNLLAKIPELHVTSRSSAFSFKGQNLDVPTMAARLNVAHVLEGSVRKSGNQLRITTQLIEVDTDKHLWSETYDRELKNVFAIQDEIAAAVVDAMQITLLGKKPETLEIDAEAYALYLQGRHFVGGKLDDIGRGEALLQQALELAPDYVPALIQLSSVYMRQAIYGMRPRDEGFEMARHAIEQALDIDPQSGSAWSMLAGIEIFYSWDFTAAEQYMQKALALNSGDIQVLKNAARLERVLGRVNGAIDRARQIVALDPLSTTGHRYLGQAYRRAGRLEEAADSLQMAFNLSPSSIASHYIIGRVLLAQGDIIAALETFEKEPIEGFRLTGIALVQHAMGDALASDAALQELIECCTGFGASQIAAVYAYRGEIDTAFYFLEQAYDYPDGAIIFMKANRLLVNLHDDPRWGPLLDKIGLPH
jgi:adenylate cyclase